MRTERRPLFGFLFRLLWRISVVWAVVSGFALKISHPEKVTVTANVGLVCGAEA